MKTHEFLARVREQGAYPSQAAAERVTQVVLGVLARRLDPREVKDLAAQLPEPLQEALLPDGSQERFGVEEFVRRIADELGVTVETAKWDASAVLTTLAEAVSGGELNQVLTQPPAGYALLFGKPDLA